ncbi:MAG: hypothetical protein N2517_05225 [Ignavibacteria bacterium]|nr:hypothetical protein [Ignavibacteria bacterium]
MEKTRTLPSTFEKRLDFYWKSIAIYSIILILYALMRGTIERGRLTTVVSDPIVILLVAIIVFSIIGYVINTWKSPKIIIGKDYIIFKTRIREKKISITDIVKIQIGQEKIANLKHSFRVIRFFVKDRKRPFRIRPSYFSNEKELVETIHFIKKTHNK